MRLPHLFVFVKGLNEHFYSVLSLKWSSSVGGTNLTSPLGRGTRQRGEGMGCLGYYPQTVGVFFRGLAMI